VGKNKLKLLGLVDSIIHWWVGFLGIKSYLLGHKRVFRWPNCPLHIHLARTTTGYQVRQYFIYECAV